MSGVGGIYRLDGAPADPGMVETLLATLRRRGPHGAGTWVQGPVGLAHTTLASTPQAAMEAQPLALGDPELAITADARLDNREELRRLLGVHPDGAVGDGELILRAYRKWGEDCPQRLLGDFAFALWDAREQKLFCARDPFGVRPFFYHHAPGRLFAFASETAGVTALEEVPYHLNEARIADFLVTQLEGMDTTSTFFRNVFRLPPAHTLMVDRQGTRLRRYWRLEPGPELRLGSPEAYGEAFLEVFREAVACRLRGPAGSVGALLSGGIDSGSVVAVAREEAGALGQSPFPTFSGVEPDPEGCTETRAIHAAKGMEGLNPRLVSTEDIPGLLPELEPLVWSPTEPFDHHATLLHVLYREAARAGVHAVLDGTDGDILLAEGSYMAHLLRRGRWLKAYREAAGRNRFLGGGHPPFRRLLRSALQAFAPDLLWERRRGPPRRVRREAVRRNLETSLIDPDFARQVDLAGRLEALRAHRAGPRLPDLRDERARAITHPYLTVGLERFQRLASAQGLESRHPFVDLRVAELCASLPGSQTLEGGWLKPILRHAMAGRLPEEIRWRRGKERLGWAFTRALMAASKDTIELALRSNQQLLLKYMGLAKLEGACRSHFQDGSEAQAPLVYEAAHLAEWLRRHQERPKISAEAA